MPEIVVYGAGGMGKEVAEALMATSERSGGHFAGFLDDRAELRGQRVLGHVVLGGAEWIREHLGVEVVLGMGHPLWRYQAVERVVGFGGRVATLLHPRATISPSAMIGGGAVVFHGCIVSSEARIGSFTYLNYNAVISHDAQIGDYACVMGQAAISGNVRVGQGAFIGVGVSTRQGVTVGDWSLVGAGAVVTEDIPPFCAAVGVPARPIRHYSSRENMPQF